MVEFKSNVTGFVKNSKIAYYSLDCPNPYKFTIGRIPTSMLFSFCLLQGRVDLCGGLTGRSAQQHAAMTAYPPSDWSSSSGVSGMTPSIPPSYAPTVVSSPSLASAHQSSFDDSESTSVQECFDDLFINHHGEGTSNANDSDDGLPMDVEDASDILTAAVAAVAATAISMPNFHDSYAPSNLSFQPKVEMDNNAHQQSHVLEMAAFQAVVQSGALQALRHQQQPTPSNSSSPIGDHQYLHSRRVLPAVHGSVAAVVRQEPSTFRSGGHQVAPYPVGLPLGSHPVATPNFQTDPAASTSFAIPSTVIVSFPS